MTRSGKYLRYLSSTKLTLGLLFTLVISSILATLINIDIYHSWWFVGILGLLSLHIAVCSLNRWPSLVSARKRKLPLLGFYLTHLSLLFILSGGLIGGLTGFSTQVVVNEGEILPIKEAPGLSVKLNDFWIEYYPDSEMPKDFKSDLTLIQNGQEAVKKTIEVNDPLNYKGVRFYQSTYSFGDADEVDLEINGKQFKLAVGEELTLPDSEGRIRVVDFIPDFVMTESGEVVSRSMEPNNPAVRVELSKGGEEPFRFWLFHHFPDFHHQEDHGLEIKLKGFHQVVFSGLQVVKDPGVPFVWIGCVLLMIGLCISLFRLHRRMKITPQRHGGTEE
ncbi:MAG: cytochrome c biogenesis protein ResB [bacterium]|nr:cytochrome c biogenesis protein ResB [bacterium]